MFQGSCPGSVVTLNKCLELKFRAYNFCRTYYHKLLTAIKISGVKVVVVYLLLFIYFSGMEHCHKQTRFELQLKCNMFVLK